MRFTLSILLVGLFASGCAHHHESKNWTFVSLPDWLNNDIRYPEPTWDDALDFTLESVKSEAPDFVLVAGDLVMGRWWDGEKHIKHWGKRYYTDWIDRMKAQDLKYYAVVGDHEVGDNPWKPNGRRTKKAMGTMKCANISDLPFYEKAFVKHLKMPKNGPKGKEGLTYYFIHNNILFICVDVFEEEHLQEAERGAATFTGNQVTWFEDTVRSHPDVNMVVVVGHTPIAGPVRKQNSSGLMLQGGVKSPLWKVMAKHGVSLYLCGEVHAVTCIEKDGIEQISHGSLFGYNEIVHYLVGKVTPEAVHLELKAIKTELSGENLGGTYGNDPREYVSITEENKNRGFITVGTMTIDLSGDQRVFRDKTGIFLETNNPKTDKEGRQQGNKILEPLMK